MRSPSNSRRAVKYLALYGQGKSASIRRGICKWLLQNSWNRSDKKKLSSVNPAGSSNHSKNLTIVLPQRWFKCSIRMPSYSSWSGLFARQNGKRKVIKRHFWQSRVTALDGRKRGGRGGSGRRFGRYGLTCDIIYFLTADGPSRTKNAIPSTLGESDGWSINRKISTFYT